MFIHAKPVHPISTAGVWRTPKFLLFGGQRKPLQGSLASAKLAPLTHADGSLNSPVDLVDDFVCRLFIIRASCRNFCSLILIWLPAKLSNRF